MFIITYKENNVVRTSGQNLDYLENGYPRILDTNISFPKEKVNVFEVNSIPEDFVSSKYCYTEIDGFYKNPNYIEPISENIYNIPDKTYLQITNDFINSIENEVSAI